MEAVSSAKERIRVIQEALEKTLKQLEFANKYASSASESLVELSDKLKKIENELDSKITDYNREIEKNNRLKSEIVTLQKLHRSKIQEVEENIDAGVHNQQGNTTTEGRGLQRSAPEVHTLLGDQHPPPIQMEVKTATSISDQDPIPVKVGKKKGFFQAIKTMVPFAQMLQRTSEYKYELLSGNKTPSLDSIEPQFAIKPEQGNEKDQKSDIHSDFYNSLFHKLTIVQEDRKKNAEVERLEAADDTQQCIGGRQVHSGSQIEGVTQPMGGVVCSSSPSILDVADSTQPPPVNYEFECYTPFLVSEKGGFFNNPTKVQEKNSQKENVSTINYELIDNTMEDKDILSQKNSIIKELKDTIRTLLDEKYELRHHLKDAREKLDILTLKLNESKEK